MTTPIAATPDSSTVVKRSPIKTTKCKWLKCETKRQFLSFETIKEQIGQCTLCLSTPSADHIQLPKCQCIFCRTCFLKFLDNFGVPEAALKKEIISKDFFRRKQHQGRYLFSGLFDANDLTFEGDELPRPIRPPLIKSTACLVDQIVRQRRHCQDKQLYKLVKKEKFSCPNCHTGYKLNRLNLKRNRVVSDIITCMNQDPCLVQNPPSGELSDDEKAFFFT